jgi:lipoprotein signal peptidase
MKPILKLIVAIILLLCLADMPYGFYTLVRFVSAFIFAFLSYDYFKSKKDGLGFVFAALALLFQPFFKVALGRTIWNIVDVVVAVGLLYLLISTFKRKR